MDGWEEPARRLPVIGTPDVVVVGAGSAGIAAAVAAARRGADTWLIERSGSLGGPATVGLINLLLTLDDGAGTQVVAGLCQELVERLAERGHAVFPPPTQWGSDDEALVERGGRGVWCGARPSRCGTRWRSTPKPSSTPASTRWNARGPASGCTPGSRAWASTMVA